MISRTVKHYLAPLERGSRREQIRSRRRLPLSGPTVCWRNDGITREPQRRPSEATGVVLDEHTFQPRTPVEIYRENPSEKLDGIYGGFVSWGNFPTRLIDIDRLHPKKGVLFRIQQNLAYSIRTPCLSRTFPISRVLFYHVAPQSSGSSFHARIQFSVRLPLRHVHRPDGADLGKRIRYQSVVVVEPTSSEGAGIIEGAGAVPATALGMAHSPPLPAPRENRTPRPRHSNE